MIRYIFTLQKITFNICLCPYITYSAKLRHCMPLACGYCGTWPKGIVAHGPRVLWHMVQEYCGTWAKGIVVHGPRVLWHMGCLYCEDLNNVRLNVSRLLHFSSKPQTNWSLWTAASIAHDLIWHWSHMIANTSDCWQCCYSMIFW